jgi:hypothetical protein
MLETLGDPVDNWIQHPHETERLHSRSLETLFQIPQAFSAKTAIASGLSILPREWAIEGGGSISRVEKRAFISLVCTCVRLTFIGLEEESPLANAQQAQT